MRVLFLQRQPCIRAMKYAIALRARHPEISLAFAYQGRTLTGWYGTGDELFDSWWPLPTEGLHEALGRVIERVGPDLIHSHNLPDLLTVAAVEATGGAVPVVHDSHDLQSLRATPYEDGFDDPEDPLELEAAAVAGCSAFVAVSQEMLDAVVDRHGAPARTLLFANYTLERDLAPAAVTAPAGRSHGPLRAVYQGSLSANGSHYDIRDHLAAVVASGLEVDVYPNREAPEYRELAQRTPGLRIMDTVDPATLLQRLPAYDVGLALFNDTINRAHIDTALPNKAFEYLASGLPIVAGPHRALMRLVADQGVGVVVEDPATTAQVLQATDLGAIRARVGERRHDFTAEGHIGELVDLYRAVALAPVVA